MTTTRVTAQDTILQSNQCVLSVTQNATARRSNRLVALGDTLSTRRIRSIGRTERGNADNVVGLEIGRDGGYMGKDSGISWTDHTFSPWWGCEKVSPACENCYAESTANRWGKNVWGKNAPRRFMSENHWRQPLKWNKAAAKAEKPALVFCASMADVFEDRPDLVGARQSLWDLIEITPWLRWMLLTKRPENILDMQPAAWKRNPRRNVWHGTTAENQRRADERIPILRRVPSQLLWVSAEPLLGAIDFSNHLPQGCHCGARGNADCMCFNLPGIDWIIVGGESGAKARPLQSTWANMIRAQCLERGARYHFKQTGGVLARKLGLKNKEGKDASEWPAYFKVQEFPTG